MSDADSLAKNAGKILLAGLAFYLGSMVGSGIAAAAGIPVPALPEGVDPATLGLYLLAAAPLVPLALAPVSRRLAVGTHTRWAILALLAWIPLGVNTALEAKVFSPAQAAVTFSALTYGIAAAACAGAVARLFPFPAPPEAFGQRARTFLTGRAPAAWAVRAALAVAAFPAVYVVFGMAVRPFIESYYVGGELGLRIPGWGELLAVLTLRSGLFLVACVPVLIAWRGSSRRLIAALGLALFVLVGGFQMLQSYWLPGTMRIAHALEILADSLAYSALLVVLLRPGRAVPGRTGPATRRASPIPLH